ncbi:MAG: hypothetical protein ACRDP6_42585 [Actinoallomurus sp.]
MHAHQKAPGGQWVPTWASDIREDDRIRRDGEEYFVVSRTETPGSQPTYRIEYGTHGETIGKMTTVAIWDPDGSVAERVMSISAAAIR